MKKTTLYKSGSVTISVNYGYDIHRVTFSGKTYNQINRGIPVTIKGQGFDWEGEPDQDYWEFNRAPCSLDIYTESGGEIYSRLYTDAEIEIIGPEQ